MKEEEGKARSVGREKYSLLQRGVVCRANCLNSNVKTEPDKNKGDDVGKKLKEVEKAPQTIIEKPKREKRVGKKFFPGLKPSMAA